MGKTRDLFKKIRDTKGIFHAKMGTIKYRYSMDLTEAEEIKKRWQEYTEELYKKDLYDLDNHVVMVTPPERPESQQACSRSCLPGQLGGGEGHTSTWNF